MLKYSLHSLEDHPYLNFELTRANPAPENLIPQFIPHSPPFIHIGGFFGLTFFESFSADSPPLYDPSLEPSPADPDSGRSNNQGFEGLTFSNGSLYALLQSASVQDGGLEKYTNRYSRLVKYTLDDEGKNPTLTGEWVVPLPTFEDPSKSDSKNPRTAAQSELRALGDAGKFFILARDSGAGRGME